MDTFRAAGSDRKLSELGLDLPDFLDPVIDSTELYTSSINSSSVTSFDFCSDRQHSAHEHQSFSYQNGSGYHHNPEHCNNQFHHSQQYSTTKDASNTYIVVDSRTSGNTRYALSNATLSNDKNPLTADLRLVDVDGDADDDEVVLSNGWLDDILDDDDESGGQAENPSACVTSDDVNELQHVSGEHSYSLSNDSAENDLDSFDIKIESDYIDIDGGLFEMINPADLSLLSGTEMTSAVAMSGVDDDLEMSSSLCSRAGNMSDDVTVHSIIKFEPLDASSTDSCYSMSPGHSPGYDVTDNVELPLTPPSSNSCSSESEAGGLSPRRSPPVTPTSPRHVITAQRLQQQHLHKHVSNNGDGVSQHNIWTASLSTSHHQTFHSNPIPTSGILILSDEEKRTLVAEGYPVPSKLPLTKQEEKNLKKIRRKIKNKISAQESRRKKKEYLETLEKKVEVVSIENISLRKKIDLLENNNRSLASQLHKLQSLASKLTSQMQAASCIAVN